MAEVTEKSIIVNGVDKYLVADLKRVYGGVSYQGEAYVFLQFPVVGDTVRDYRPDSYTTAIMLGDEVFDGQTFLHRYPFFCGSELSAGDRNRSGGLSRRCVYRFCASDPFGRCLYILWRDEISGDRRHAENGNHLGGALHRRMGSLSGGP